MQFFRPLSPVKAITFDLDDTLYNNEPIIRKAEAALQHHIGKHHPRAATLTPQQWHQLKVDSITNNPLLASDMGRLRLSVLRMALSEDFGLSMKDNGPHTELDAAVKLCFDCFYDARSNFTLADEVHQTLSTLAQSLPLVAITNGNVNAKKVGIDKYFHHIYHASVKRRMKPARDMFDEASQALDLPPENILHVGDNLKKDVYAAINAGFQSAWFACNRPMQLRNERVSVLPHIVLDSLAELTVFTR
jgi:HAD superfamily hydrolase (TIGR01549 family)